MADAFLDLDDPMVREMADRNHTPRETWMGQRDGPGFYLANVTCDTCEHPWPCPTRVAIRVWTKRQPDRG